MSERAKLRFNVSPTSGVPIYRQLMDQVRARVAGGRLEPGDPLPSVRQVAEDLEINPMTVSRAYSLLQHDGVLLRVRGQGMRIANGESAGTLKQRQDELRPLLRQVVAKAHQLSLTPQQVRAALEPLLKELKQ